MLNSPYVQKQKEKKLGKVDISCGNYTMILSTISILVEMPGDNKTISYNFLHWLLNK